jgi:DNA-binding response OmpR family regulator
MEELIARIHNLLSLSGSGNKSGVEKIKLGKYHFFPNRYELHLDEVIKKLSHREASLLNFLVTSPNTTIERKEILLKLWGDDSFFNSRNLDVYITKIRDYLKNDPTIEIITIKGIGYRFVLDR